MSNSTRFNGARRYGVALTVGLASFAVPGAVQAAEVEPALGTAYDYSVLAAPTVTNTGLTTLSGNLGVSPGNALVGFGGPPNGTVLGATHAGDASSLQAQVDLGTGYDTAAGEPSSADKTGQDLVGQLLTPGTYNWTGDITHSGTVTLDAQGDPAARFIFQVARDMVTSTGFQVALAPGTTACNIYWQVGRDAVIGNNNTFVGTIMANGGITVGNSTTVDGRALARTAAVTLDTNTFTTPACVRGLPTTQGAASSAAAAAAAAAAANPAQPVAAPVANTPGAGSQPPPASRTTRRTRRGTSVLRRTAPRPGAKCTDGFSARVRGSYVKSVVFRLDGKRISTKRRSPFSVYVKAAGKGKHKVTAKVSYVDATRAKTMTLRYRGCAAAALQPRRGPSQFTG